MKLYKIAQNPNIAIDPYTQIPYAIEIFIQKFFKPEDQNDATMFAKKGMTGDWVANPLYNHLMHKLDESYKKNRKHTKAYDYRREQDVIERRTRQLGQLIQNLGYELNTPKMQLRQKRKEERELKRKLQEQQEQQEQPEQPISKSFNWYKLSHQKSIA